jgi:eukaryotic-like serine/threonine-protein kinase
MIVTASITYQKLYQIGVGQGLHSEVYLAIEPQLGGQVAVKEIPKANFINTDYFAEAKTMFAAAHPHVVRVQYACSTAHIVGIAMPFYATGSLQTRITAAPLSLADSIRVGLAAASGLRHIHGRGYLHLDVKPSNVLFDDRDEPLVSDFGQSRIVGPAGVVTAPPMYQTTMPPDVLATGVADVRADVYHLGVLLYRMVNGDPFYKAQMPWSNATRADAARALLTYALEKLETEGRPGRADRQRP